MKNQKNGFAVQGIIALIGLLLLAGGAYVISQKQKNSDLNSNPVPENISTNTNTDLTQGWKTYTNSRNGYEIKYPANWKVEENLGVSVRLINPARQGKDDTDQPTENVTVSFKQTTCKESSWEVGFASVNYGTACISSGKGQIAEINSVAFDEQGKSVEEKIISSFKYTSRVLPGGVVYDFKGDSVSDWKTYRNQEYGFEFQYPVKGYALDDKRATESAGFRTIASVYVSPPPIEFGANFSIGARNAESITTGIDVFARNLFGNNFISIEPVTINGTNWQKVRTKDDYFEKEVSVNYFSFQGNQLYRINYFPTGSPSQSDFEKILSSFKFTSGSSGAVNPEPKPFLSTIIPSSGPVGTPVTLQGVNLNGFEGDTYLYFIKENGESGSITASSYLPAGATTLKFTLPEKMCIKNMGESDLPCPGFMTITPGTYKVYALPWGAKSNELSFTVTPSSYSMSDWKTYTNTAYGFKANFPLGTEVRDVDVTGGRSIYVSFPTGNIPPFNFQFPSLMIQVQNAEYGRNSSTIVPVQSCTSDNIPASVFLANNINFLKSDISGAFGGMESAAVAASYCTIQNGIRYTLIPKISYGRYQGTAPDKIKSFEQFDQIIRALQFQVLPFSQPFISASTYLATGENMTITGTNLDPLGAYPGIGWFTHSHVLAYLKNSNGQKGVLWEGGSQGGKQVSGNQISTTLPSKMCMISEVGAGGCPVDKYLTITPGKYSLSVYVDGRGESNVVEITVH